MSPNRLQSRIVQRNLLARVSVVVLISLVAAMPIGCQSAGSDHSRLHWPWKKNEPSYSARDQEYGRIPPPGVHDPLIASPRVNGSTRAPASYDSAGLLPPQTTVPAAP